MTILSNTNDLNKFCEIASKKPFVTVDTEFLREKTYYAELCLIQLAFKGSAGQMDSILIDPLSENIDLCSFFALMQNQNVMKVFHAARQDLEIFFTISGSIPTPFFDTQVAAMVCGFGDQISYEKLVKEFVGISLDKSSRFSNWSHRPLTSEQYRYALADVTHLRDVYLGLKSKLTANGREKWVKEEMDRLSDTKKYFVVPAEAWRKIKVKNGNNTFLALIRDLAEFREKEAQNRDITRRKIFSDDAIIEIASKKPSSMRDMSKLRFLPKEAQKNWIGENICKLVLQVDPNTAPILEGIDKSVEVKSKQTLIELLKVLLIHCSEISGVAPKLIATVDDLKEIATKDKPTTKAIEGWRKGLFGNNAMKLKNGKIALSIEGKTIIQIHSLEAKQ